MDKQTLLSYVATERRRGVRDEDIKTELITKGWAELLIRDVLADSAGTQLAVLPAISLLLKSSFDELWRNIWKAFLIMVLPMTLVGLLGFSGGVSMVLAPNPTTLLGGGGLVLLGVILMCIVTFVSTIMLIKEIVSNWTLSYSAAFSSALPHIFPLLIVAFLSSFAILGGFAVFIIPGFIASIWFSFAQISSVVDNKRGIAALLYSKALVHGNLGNVFAYYMIVGILVIITNFIVGLIPVVGQFVTLLATPFMLIFSVHLYQALKRITLVEENFPINSYRITTSLIVVGIIATLALAWLFAKYATL